MEATRQKIEDAETEAGEIQATLVAVGDALRKASTRRGKSGLTYAQFKAEYLRKKAKAATPSHACR